MGMIPVVVEMTFENYRHGSFDTSELIGPMSDWLRDNVKSYWNWEPEVQPNRGINELARWALVIRFEDAAEAALFKLTWA
jgi:hypothetical protein